MKKQILFLFAAALCAALSISCNDDTNALPEDEYLVGCEYFAGWLNKEPNSWFWKDGTDWRPLFPERLPVNGQWVDAETMRKDIDIAAANGVDFFSILWYPHAKMHDDISMINKSVGWFTASPECDKMKFMLEITNHAPFGVTSVADWEDIAFYCATNMEHASYLKIDGRPVVKIHGGGQFINDLGGAEKANEALAAIRRVIMEAGHQNPIIAVGLVDDQNIKDSVLGALDVDMSMQYTDPTHLPYLENEDYPYEMLVEQGRKDRMTRVDDSVPHVPFIAVGWNGRAWQYKLPAFELPNAENWRRALEEMKTDLDNCENFGFPRKDGSRQKAFTIYAWNEYGEGGFLSPTVGAGNMKLEVLDEVFGNR